MLILQEYLDVYMSSMKELILMFSKNMKWYLTISLSLTWLTT